MSNLDDKNIAKLVEKPKEKGFARGFVESVNPGYAVAGLSALWSGGVLAIEKNLNDLLKMNGRLDTLNHASAEGFKNVYPAWTTIRSTDEDWHKLYPDWAKVAPDMEGSHPLKPPPGWAKYFSPEELKKRQDAIDNELKRPGRITNWNNDIRKSRLAEDGITNIAHKFERLRPYQKQLVIANSVVVVAIGLGALWSYANSRSHTDKLHDNRGDNSQSQTEKLHEERAKAIELKER